MRCRKKIYNAILKGCKGTRKLKDNLYSFDADGRLDGACVIGALHLGLGNTDLVELFRAGQVVACTSQNAALVDRYQMGSDFWKAVELNNGSSMSREEIAKCLLDGTIWKKIQSRKREKHK